MKYQLINPIRKNYSAIEQILTNRGVEYRDINSYLNTTDKDVNSPLTFGEKEIFQAAAALIDTIQMKKKVKVIVDADCDGYTSSAILINYLYDLFPSWVQNDLSWIIHSGKQHGLNDCIDQLLNEDISLVILPDAGTNDTEECKRLQEHGIKVIILDHHDKEVDNPYAVIINSQMNGYPNKHLSGAGVTWQFCRYVDGLMDTKYAEGYRDLVALGLDADMVSLLSKETKHLIQTGLQQVKNPFIYNLAEKNSYSLKDKLTPIGVAFYIAPFVNAVVRSGTQEEKEKTFESMLSFKAFQIIPSTKRGHSFGETEYLVDQVMRIVTNVKARQTKVQNDSLETIEEMIIDQNLLDHKVLLFLMEPGQVDRNVAGLIANKIASKYQRPVCILTKTINDNICVYQGSARGCDRVGVTDFKGVCTATGVTEYTVGHPGAFGIGIKEDNIQSFIEKTDYTLKDMSTEAIYYVDYIFEDTIDPQIILDIASMEYYWGKDVDEALVAIKGLRVTENMVTIYRNRNNTIKIQTNDGISLMIFNATEEDCHILQEDNTGYIMIDLVGTCQQNEWMGNISPQIFITEYQVMSSNKIFF